MAKSNVIRWGFCITWVICISLPLQAKESFSKDEITTKLSSRYVIESFSRDRIYGPFQMLSMEINKKPFGITTIGRVNYAVRQFSSTSTRTGTQFEIDMYPKLRSGTYTYLNYGWSQDSILPVYRMGGEIFQSLGSGYEGSFGFRKMKFSSSEVTIWTAYIGKYFSNYWFSLRGFFTPKDIQYTKVV